MRSLSLPPVKDGGGAGAGVEWEDPLCPKSQVSLWLVSAFLRTFTLRTFFFFLVQSYGFSSSHVWM